MYSPRKQESSDSSSEDNVMVETYDNSNNDGAKPTESDNTEKENDREKSEMQNQDVNNKQEEQVVTDCDSTENSHSHYKTYDNLNELTLDKENKNDNKNEDHLREDIEILKQRVENLHMHSELSSTGSNDQYTVYDSQESGTSDNVAETVNITVVSETESDPNLVGILKESKRETIPVPEFSEEPEIKENIETGDVSDPGEPSSPPDDLSYSRKRVSFNETTEVFQSFESTSTDTVTPEHEEFDIEAASLDAQPDYGNDDNDDDDDTPDIIKLQGQKMSINIGGFELNPTVIDSEEKNADADDDTKKDEENKTTFITNPETDA
jgi:hypothetical protein